MQPVSSERFFHRSENTECGARLDVRAQGFWGVRHQQAYFDVRGFNPLASTNRCNSLASCFRSHDREKRRTYEQRVREIERASFTPLVFSALGGMSKPTETTYKRLASLLATKKNQQYNMITFIRCRLSFSLLRSAIICLCGSRSAAGRPHKDLTDFSLDVIEGKFPLSD